MKNCFGGGGAIAAAAIYVATLFLERGKVFWYFASITDITIILRLFPFSKSHQNQ